MDQKHNIMCIPNKSNGDYCNELKIEVLNNGLSISW
jgi:hypothetical protein